MKLWTLDVSKWHFYKKEGTAIFWKTYFNGIKFWKKIDVNFMNEKYMCVITMKSHSLAVNYYLCHKKESNYWYQSPFLTRIHHVSGLIKCI